MVQTKDDPLWSRLLLPTTNRENGLHQPYLTIAGVESISLEIVCSAYFHDRSHVLEGTSPTWVPVPSGDGSCHENVGQNCDLVEPRADDHQGL